MATIQVPSFNIPHKSFKSPYTMIKPKYLIYLLLFSCHPKEQKTGINKAINANTTIPLIKLDSIQIDYLGNPTVHDLDPVSETLIFMEHGEYSEEIMVADFDGNILASYSKLGDMPDSYGGLMSTLRINSDSSFIVYGYHGFMTYDFSGKLQSRVKLIDFQVPNFQMKAMGHGMERLGKRYVYIDQGSHQIDDSSPDQYQKLGLLNWLDPETGQKEPFVQFPETSIFNNGKYFFKNAWMPVFTAYDGLIHVVFGVEPTIYIYDSSPPYPLISSIPIELADYRVYKGKDNDDGGFNFISLMASTARILNIKKIEGYYIIAYSTGFNEIDQMEYFSDKSPEEAKVFRERMEKKYPHRIAIVDSLGNCLNDFVPKELMANSMLVRNGELWMCEAPDTETERDYFKLFQVGLGQLTRSQ